MSLPKELESDPRADEVRALLEADRRPIWNGGAERIPHVTVTDERALADALRPALLSRRLLQGYEQAERHLGNEQRGLEQLQGEGSKVVRPNRLLLVGTEGSERFFRNVEALARRHAGRLIVVRSAGPLDPVAAAVLGQGARAQALLVADKSVMSRVLLVLADQRARSSTS